MSTWGDKIVRDGRPDVGVGISVAPDQIPTARTIEIPEFSGGLVINANKALAAPNQAVALLDVESTRNGRLVRAAGTLIKNSESRVVYNAFDQTGLDYDSKLILIAPPEIGVKSTFNGAIVWTNHAIAATSDEALAWNALNYADDLLFSNGATATYTRDAASGAITDLSATIIARTFASAFGRAFAGAITAAGVYQGLMIQWNGSSALISDWTGDDSGAELLIADVGAADEIVAIRPIGHDALAILCRSSLWVGIPTQQSNRPADFRLRFLGFGCVSELTVALTPGGVTFLSAAGVVNYNISTAEIISQSINDDLLPLVQEGFDAGAYRATYDPVQQRYYLIGPAGATNFAGGTQCWIYEFPREGVPGRWFKRSLGNYDGIQTNYVRGITTYKGEYAALSTTRTSDPAVWFMDDSGNVGVEAYGNVYNFTGQLDPYWQIPIQADLPLDRYVQIVGMDITYETNISADVSVAAIDENGEISDEEFFTLDLAPSIKSRFLPLYLLTIGGSVRFYLSAAVIFPSIHRLKFYWIDGGPIHYAP